MVRDGKARDDEELQDYNRTIVRLGEELGVNWLPSDFKKKDGYRRSIQLSAEYGLYRQAWCGCGLGTAGPAGR